MKWDREACYSGCPYQRVWTFKSSRSFVSSTYL